MVLNRFPGKTKQYGITTTLAVVVMLHFLMAVTSCGKEKREVVEVAFDPETTFTMKATDVASLISDSGLTRYRLNAKLWLVFDKAKEPYWSFPEGIYVEKFDTLFRTEASIEADTAYYYTKKELWHLIGNVNVESLKGEHFETSELFWNQKTEKVYSDKYIRIEQEEKVITGYGFESNQNMTQYRIFKSAGIFPVSESNPDSTAIVQPADSIVPLSIPDSARLVADSLTNPMP